MNLKRKLKIMMYRHDIDDMVGEFGALFSAIAKNKKIAKSAAKCAATMLKELMEVGFTRKEAIQLLCGSSFNVKNLFG